MTDYKKLEKFLQSGGSSSFDEMSFNVFKAQLGDLRKVSEEIINLLQRFGGSSFKPNVRLNIKGNDSYEIYHFMSIGIQGGQENLIQFMEENPDTPKLPLTYSGFSEFNRVWIGIEPRDKNTFGKIYVSPDSGNRYYSDLNDLIDNIELV